MAIQKQSKPEGINDMEGALKPTPSKEIAPEKEAKKEFEKDVGAMLSECQEDILLALVSSTVKEAIDRSVRAGHSFGQIREFLRANSVPFHMIEGIGRLYQKRVEAKQEREEK